MLVAKQVADLITYLRAVLGFYLAWLGFSQGDEGLPLAVWIMIADWSGDSLDGPIARRSRVYYHTWIGDNDLLVDMLVSAGLMVYMLGAGYVQLWLAGVYLLLWLLIFYRWGFASVLGMLFQAPIYGWFVWVAIREAPTLGMWLVVWILAAIVLTWPRFPQMVVPGFLEGMRQVLKAKSKVKKD